MIHVMIKTFPEFLRMLFRPGAVLKILVAYSDNWESTSLYTDENPYITFEESTVCYEVPWTIVEWLEETGWLIRKDNCFQFHYDFVAFYNNWKDNH